jgi:hypothetical protein
MVIHYGYFCMFQDEEITRASQNLIKHCIMNNKLGGVRQTAVHTAEPFVPEPSASEVEVATGKLKRYKTPGVDQIPAELIQSGGEKLRSEIHKLIKLIWNKEEFLTSRNSQSWYLFTKRAIKLTVVVTKAYHCCQLHTKFYQTFFLVG